jgi:drug/metabolite transporter (DMT)-like permease
MLDGKPTTRIHQLKTTTYGSLWMLAAGFFFAIMGVCVKLGSTHFTSPELVFYRSIFGFLLILVVTQGNRLSLKTQHLKLHLSRSVLGFLSLIMFFYAITHLPLAAAMTLNYTSPLFLALFTTLWLREKVRHVLILAILLGFAGVVLLLNPSLHRDELVAGVSGLASGILAGFVYLQVTQLGRMGEPEWRTVFYFTLVCSLGAGLWMLAQDFHPVRMSDLPLLMGMGASATLAQLAMTRAYRKGNSLVSGSLAYTTVVFASLFGIVLWQELLSIGQWLAIGLIVASGIMSVQATKRN